MSGSEAKRAIRPTSLRRSLLLLVFVCVAPAIALVSLFALEGYRLYQRQLHVETQRLAERMIGEVDREFAGIESGLKILASSEPLRRGDLRQFYSIARNALSSQIIYNYLLTDWNGVQVLNTLVPFGNPLPRTGTPPQLTKVFSERESVLSDFFIGPVTGKPAIAMGVPVINAEGEVIYSLNIGLAPGRLTVLLKNQPLAEGWLAALLDTRGVIVSRTREEGQFVGKTTVPSLYENIVAYRNGTVETQTKEGIEVISSYATSRRWGWAVAVGAPKTLMETQLRNAAIFIVLTAAVILSAATWIAFYIIRKLTHSVEALNAAAQSIHDGKVVELPLMQLVEAEDIGRAIVRAAELSSEVHYKAYHDTLTELANRSLFYEFLANSLARAQRSGEPFSLLMVDLDNFKQINDREGHAVGDAVLRIAAQRIREEIRKEDLAARLGGDEFAVLLVNSEGGAVMDVAHRISERLALPYAGCNIPTSASIGVVSWHADFSNGADMLERADKALYRAKAKGKNTISL